LLAAPPPRSWLDALRVQAMVATRQHHWSEAEQALEEGLTLARSMPYPYAEGRLLHVYGLMHVHKGEPELARERLEAALAIFRGLAKNQDGMCPICGDSLFNGEEIQKDHITPREQDGTDGDDNAQLVHLYCHQQKTAMDRSKPGLFREWLRKKAGLSRVRGNP
jgi:hypothetical protein